MSNDLHIKPETKIELSDMAAITDPRRQKELASNQGVRFYVEQQLMSQEDAIMRAMSDGFAAQSEAWRQLNEEVGYLNRELGNIQKRLMFLETRWYERLMQDFEWDWLVFRAWLYRRFKIGTDPDLIDPYEDMKHTIDDMQERTLVAEVQVDPEAEAQAMREFAETATGKAILVSGDMTVDEVIDAVQSPPDEEDAHKCICGHVEYVHSFDGDGPCQEEGCGCQAYESLRV